MIVIPKLPDNKIFICLEEFSPFGQNRSNNCKNQTSNRTSNQTSNRTSNQTSNSATNEHKHPNQYTKGADDEGAKNSTRSSARNSR